MPDLLAITETWLSSNTSDNLVNIDDYSLFRNDRSSRIGGNDRSSRIGDGVALYMSRRNFFLQM